MAVQVWQQPRNMSSTATRTVVDIKTISLLSLGESGVVGDEGVSHCLCPFPLFVHYDLRGTTNVGCKIFKLCL